MSKILKTVFHAIRDEAGHVAGHIRDKSKDRLVKDTSGLVAQRLILVCKGGHKNKPEESLANLFTGIKPGLQNGPKKTYIPGFAIHGFERGHNGLTYVTLSCPTYAFPLLQELTFFKRLERRYGKVSRASGTGEEKARTGKPGKGKQKGYDGLAERASHADARGLARHTIEALAYTSMPMQFLGLGI